MGNAMSDCDDSSEIVDAHAPSMADVAVLSRNILESPNLLLPTVLLLEILSYGFCPLIVKAVAKHTLFRGGGNQNEVYLSMTLSSSFQRHLNQIEFEINSKDQGWSSYPAEHGTRSSYTWGEVSLSCSPHERHHVYKNIHAGKDFERQVVRFTSDHEFCRAVHQNAEKREPVELQLWLRSQYPGWQQTVKNAEMRALWQFTEWQEYSCELGSNQSVLTGR